MGTNLKPLNPLGSIPKDDRPKDHYVYFHRRGSADGEIFYVGKGTNRRAWCLDNRKNRHWLAVAKKYGVYVDILESGLTKSEALNLEIATISDIGIDNLTNASIGGESGRAGIKAWNRRKVYCSNGLEFESAKAAAYWIYNQTGKEVSGSAITGCCLGKYNGAYGYSWSYDKDDIKEYKSRDEQCRKVVYCSNGMRFDSQKQAAEWVSENVSKGANSSNINAALKGTQKSAFGFSWAYKIDDLKEYNQRKTHPRAVLCSNGMRFPTISAAARWLNDNGHPTARPGGICETLKGRQRKSYGYGWRYDT